MSKHLLWDIDDGDQNYTFTKGQIEPIDYMEMINLNIRGTTSNYKLPSNMYAGKILTIKNRDFGLQDQGFYCGVKFILNNDDDEQEKSSYYFFFKDQTVSFIFNGSHWSLKDPWPFENTKMNIVKDVTEYGYLSINDYHDKSKKILFNNVRIPLLFPKINGLYFRENKLSGVIQKEETIKHTHKEIENHKHKAYVASAPEVNHILDLGTVLFINNWWTNICTTWWGWMTFPGFAAYIVLFKSAWSILAWLIDLLKHNYNINEFSLKEYKYEMDSETPSLITNYVNPGLELIGEESRPKTINGKFVLKAW